MSVDLAVSLGLWLDRPSPEVRDTATIADECGFAELWVGEMATYDAFALATSIGATTTSISLTVGPLAVSVRDPVTIAMGAASVADLTGRTCGVALGTSSPVVVESWHGRSRARPARTLRESATACRQLLAGERGHLDGEVLRTDGFRLRLAPPGGPLTVAAFGPAAIRVAAELGDRMVANLVSVAELEQLSGALDAAANGVERAPRPKLCVWVPTAVDPSRAAIDQIRRAAVAYLAAPGYAEMFIRAGFEDVVAMARDGAHPKELLAAVPDDLATAIGAVGDIDTVLDQLEAYGRAGADQVVIVPSATDDDPAGERTLRSVGAARMERTAPASVRG